MKKKDILIGLLIALTVAIFLSPFASSFPDGLEWVAEKIGFLEKGEGEPALKAPLPDYIIPGVKNEKVATSLAGLVGTIAVFGIGYGAAKIMARKKN